ncbi:hypothetical protein X777_00881, partial [Ooceraea biroi]
RHCTRRTNQRQALVPGAGGQSWRITRDESGHSSEGDEKEDSRENYGKCRSRGESRLETHG